MKKVVFLALALLAFTLSHASSASATVLTNTSITNAQFEAIATGLPLLSFSASPFTFAGGTAGTVASAAFSGEGIATGDFLYTYRVTVTSGAVSQISLLFGAANVVTTLNLDGIAGADTSFFISDAPAGTLAGFYASNGTVAPSGTPASEVDDITGSYRTHFSPSLTATSRIFGVISTLSPGSTIADMADSGGTTASPTVVSPIPEPGTLFLLGSGLTSLAAWGWRRKKVS